MSIPMAGPGDRHRLQAHDRVTLTGLWDATYNPSADEKSPLPSAQKSSSRQTVLVHPQAEMHCSNDPVLSPTATTLENDSN
jgi:hypothetical protein